MRKCRRGSLFIFAEVSRACGTITQKFHDVTARAEMSCHFIKGSIRDTVHDWEYDQLRHLAHDCWSQVFKLNALGVKIVQPWILAIFILLCEICKENLPHFKLLQFSGDF